MKDNNNKLEPGTHFMLGNHAIAEAAIIAGCKFFGAYPITPATPIAERLSYRLLDAGGEFIQMEDEIAAAISLIGASAAGAKSMTATSGPGLSLMVESIGLSYVMEIPIIIVDIMRGGPSTGMPTLTSQGDIMQARYGSHGDYDMIAYCPSTVQECFDFTIKAFNAAEKYRTPVIVLGDQILGLSTANFTVPPHDEIEIIDRVKPADDDPEYKVYNPEYLIAPMAVAGQGHRVHMTGLTHDERGYPATDPANHAIMMKHLRDKIELNVDEIVEYDEFMMEDAEIAIVAFGSNARPVKQAIRKARELGYKVGLWRPITIWPFPEKQILELSQKVNKIIVAEVNLGQYVHPVREYADRTKCEIYSLTHPGGAIHTPDDVLEKIEEVMK
ncbi:MAG: 2-oxoglutarate synthase subunit KorA [Candidatus Heimdallarchaeota archaeon LC_2]|nr:MAG: 2-oxoglutarate synthase subunit KorA [Candidatus Heimdallarchaeota archaeon LC_2]